MDETPRRAFLATAAGGVAALAGCVDALSGNSPDDSEGAVANPDGDDSDGGDGGDGSGSGDTDGDSGGANGGDGSTPDEQATQRQPNNDEKAEGETPSPETQDVDVGMPLQEPTTALTYEIGALEADAVSGGVPKDGIPSVDDPTFESASDGDGRLDPEDPVFGVVRDGVARAYPQYILVFHEIVNDTIAGENVAVTYCPLTGTALGFERGDVEFGVSGMLVNSNLIMYDRETDSWWPQMHPVSPKGELTGWRLSEFRVTWTTWERWTETYPDTQVLTEDTGAVRNYGSDPYGSYNPDTGYYTQNSTLFPPRNESDDFHPKEVFIGARSEDGAVAFNKNTLRDQPLLEATLDGTQYLAAYHDGLDSAWVYRNTEETSFDVTEEGYEGPEGTVYGADELPLEPVDAYDTMWFPWFGYYPETYVVA